MATLVLLREGDLVGVHPVDTGLTLGLGDRGIPEPVPPGDLRALVRFTARGEGLQVVPQPGAPPLTRGGRPCQGATFFPGDRLSLGSLELRLAPSAPSGLGPAVQQELFQLVSSASSREDPGELLGELLEHAVGLFRAERGFVLFRENRNSTPGPIASHHITPDEIDSRISRTALERAQAASGPVLFGDTSQELEGSESTRIEGIRSILCSPLGERGALYLDSRASSRSFSDRDLEVFTALSGYARLALQLWLEADGLRRQAARARLEGRQPSPMVVGPSRAMADLMEELEAVAREDVTVLVQGETGTGKEVLAREIHRRSRRSGGPFVAVHCMALAPEVVESELFGHEKGAFTGASQRRLGRFELADGGTLFLDEVGELSLELQVKLLRVLQERQVERVGGDRPRPVDIRIVAATNQPLEERIRSGQFREDLFYRLNVFRLRPPPLRERREDIPELARHFLAEGNRKMGKQVRDLSPEALDRLRSHDWPGNVRELANVLERALVLERSDRIGPGAVRGLSGEASPEADGEAPRDFFSELPPGLNAAREVFERELIRRALEAAGGNVSQAARSLEIPRSTVYRKAELLGLDLDRKP